MKFDTQDIISAGENENLFKNLVLDLPVAVYTCDADGYIKFYNKASVNLWGKEPVPGKDRWCGSWKIFHTDGSPMAIDQCPMAIAIRESRPVDGEEIIIERPDGKRIHVVPHPQPIFNSRGEAIGAVNMLLDVTKQKEAEQNLRDNEERLRNATEGTKLAIWDINMITDKIIYSNRLADIFGQPQSKILTHTELLAKIHPEDLQNIVVKALTIAIKTGVYTYEARIILPDKSIRWIRTNGNLTFDSNQKPLRLIGTMLDITEYQINRDSLSRLAAIVQSSDDAIIGKTLEGIITSWNDSAVNIFGYTSEEMIGCPITKLIPPDRFEEEPEIIFRIKKGQRVEHFETQRITKDGKFVDIALTISPIKDFHGTVIGASEIAHDVTRQKIVEKLKTESEDKFRLLAESIPQFIWTCDSSGNFNYFNETTLDYVGLSLETILQEGWLKVIHPEEKEFNQIKWREAVKTGNDFFIDHRLRRSDGEYRWYLSRATSQKDDEGKVVMWVGTSSDIHEYRLFTEELETQVQQRTKELSLLNADLVKSNSELAQFAYVASHDLQEPLRKIQTFATRIIQKEKENLSPNGIDYFDRMQSAANRMQILIEDLLTYSRINTAEKVYDLTDLNLIVQEVKIELDQIIQEKKAVIKSDSLPMIKIIPFQFRQLFTNLISNSLKFSRDGVTPEISIGIDIIIGDKINFKEADKFKNYYSLSFADNGIGFEPQFKTRIFELFQRLHGKSEYSGTGIGLAICKKIAENHYGFIEADSKPGEGAIFKIFIPVNN